MKKDTGLYVHIPFCVSKCVYCDFLSAAPENDLQIKKYISSLAEEIRSRAQRIPYDLKRTDSVFFGGGTPSLIPAGELFSLMKVIKREFEVRENAEITIECNPGTVSKDALYIYKEAGINRISFGLQSANDKELELLGRIHRFGDFEKSFEFARAAGFDNINVDLMSAIPGHRLGIFKETLRRVVGMRPEHISCYSLILEEGTYLYENEDSFPPFPDEDTEREMYAEARDFLKANGYRQYEISNFARKENGRSFECRHNLGYWDRAVYFGFGTGAASFDGKVRYKNISDISEYMAAKDKEDRKKRECLSREDAMSEFMFLGLRKTKGISAQAFRESFGVGVEEIYGEVIKTQVEEGLIYETKEGYALTERGVDVSNAVLAEYV